jgi:tetratricopeptide (TPR) repeat protein
MHHPLRIVCGVFSLIVAVLHTQGQTNCSLFTDSNKIKACRFYNQSDSFAQGTRACEDILDSALHYWPGYAEAWHEKSVPYLKRGDFFTWRKYVDQAVALKPMEYLGVRAWCRFKFLHDFEGAMSDLRKLDTMTQFNPGQSGDGNYDLHIVMALCERGSGHYKSAFHYFSIGIDTVLRSKGKDWIGLYDYLHRAVMRIQLKDYAGALSDLDRQIDKYPRFAETYYYRGRIFLLTGQKAAAKKAFERSKLLFISEGYHFHDPYCVMFDEVSLDDITTALARASAATPKIHRFDR